MRPRTWILWSLGLSLGALVVIASALALAGPQLLPGLFVLGLRWPAVALTALTELGPVGATCLSRGTPYEYVPAKATTHWGVLRELPEVAVGRYVRAAGSAAGARAEEVSVEHVAVNLHQPNAAPTEARTRVRWSDGTQGVYAVRMHSDGGSSWVSLDAPTIEVMLCSKNFGSWTIDEVEPISPGSPPLR